MKFKPVILVVFTAMVVPSLALAQTVDSTSSVSSGSSSSAPNAFAALIFMVIWTGMYFTPGIVATMRKHPSVLAIWVCNFFLGWTVVGWIVTLIWALGRAFNASPQNIVVTQVNAPVAAPSRADSVAPSKLTPQQVSEQIDGLVALKEKGYVTEDEFAQKKAEILARLG